ncbi:MAG: Rpn family recombination-promoting nuclease/putative transposase [Cyanothece sp. SIO2G6]|nr:Rpn family recombination-promoting nuclease/putative transposase [Cyanothece sp. SIO2G6]
MVFLFKERYINLLTDFGFKRVFGTEANKQFTIDFLNTLLPPHHQIQNLSFKNNENLGLAAMDRRAVFDVFCQSRNGEQFIVEMQRTRQAFFKDRSPFYATFPIQEQSTRGDWDYQLTSVYTVSVLDFVMVQPEKNSNFIHRVELKDDDGDRFYDKLAFIYIELPKFTKVLEQLTTHEDKWFYLFRYLPELTDQPEVISDPVFDDLFSVAEIANFPPDEQDVYQATLKAYRDFNNVMNTAIQEATEEALEQGAERERSRFLRQQRSLVLRLLTRQLGQLPDQMSAQIQQLSLDDLEVLADALLDFNQMDDLRLWLEQSDSV